MPTIKTISFDDLMLEADVHSLMEKLDEVAEHIKANIPDEIFLNPDGSANTRSHWGAIYHHVTFARASLVAFL